MELLATVALRESKYITATEASHWDRYWSRSIVAFWLFRRPIILVRAVTIVGMAYNIRNRLL